MRLRFVVGDYNDGSVVEAGVDNLRVFGVECDDTPSIPGDLNGDGLVNGSDVGLFLAVWGTSDPNADLNGNGITVSNAVWEEMKPNIPTGADGKPEHPISASALAPVRRQTPFPLD